ncbi:MAG: hypothetical protein ACP5O2_03540 [Bacteroidales bacterium]
MRLKFLHTPKPRGYSYQPVYYNPEQEKPTVEKKETEGSDRLRREMEARWRANRRKNRASTIQLAVYLLIILAVLYFIFFVW